MLDLLIVAYVHVNADTITESARSGTKEFV